MDRVEPVEHDMRDDRVAQTFDRWIKPVGRIRKNCLVLTLQMGGILSSVVFQSAQIEVATILFYRNFYGRGLLPFQKQRSREGKQQQILFSFNRVCPKQF